MSEKAGRGHRGRPRGGLGRLGLACLFAASLHAAAWAAPWPAQLDDALVRLDAKHPGELAVWVRELASGDTVAHGAGQRTYLASMVKLPVAIAVLRGVERGEFSLDSPLTLRESDYVDGAGPTNAKPVGASLPVHWLIEQMIVHSDNTASDMLIGLVGLRAVNAVAEELGAGGLGPITRLADVRRRVYAELTPAAWRLEGRDFLRLHARRSDAQRVGLLAELVDEPLAHFRQTSLAAAYDAYYRTGLNAGRLDAYGALVEQLARGRALDEAGTAYLLASLERVQTGQRRIVAGLPRGLRFAHKTGTQRERVCDAGLLRSPGTERQVVVVACVSGEPSLARAERLLAEVGAAIARSGVLPTAEAP